MSLLEEVFSRCVLSLDERTLVLAGEMVVLEMNRDSSSSRVFARPLTSAGDRVYRVKSETSFDGNRRSVLCTTHTSAMTVLSRAVTILVGVPSYGYSPQTHSFLTSIPHAEERPSFLIISLFVLLFLSHSLLLTVPISFIHNVCEMRKRGRGGRM